MGLHSYSKLVWQHCLQVVVAVNPHPHLKPYGCWMWNLYPMEADFRWLCHISSEVLFWLPVSVCLSICLSHCYKCSITSRQLQLLRETFQTGRTFLTARTFKVHRSVGTTSLNYKTIKCLTYSFVDWFTYLLVFASVTSLWRFVVFCCVQCRHTEHILLCLIDKSNLDICGKQNSADVCRQLASLNRCRVVSRDV